MHDLDARHAVAEALPLPGTARRRRLLHDAGIDVVSQANNHAVDYGWKAFADAQSLLADAGRRGHRRGCERGPAHTCPVVIERNGLRVAFLAYLGVFTGTLGWSGYDWEATDDHAGLALARLRQINHDVKRAKQLADVVVVYYHAGVEMDPNPSQLERNIARVAFKSGASLVVGAHPHVLQTTSRHGHRLVAYSLGNFVFDMNGPARPTRHPGRSAQCGRRRLGARDPDHRSRWRSGQGQPRRRGTNSRKARSLTRICVTR